MRSPKVLTTAVAGAIALSLGLAACGGGDDGGTDSGGSGGGVKFDAGSTAVVNPSDKKGGVLKTAVSDDFDSTDPGDTYYAFGNNFIRTYARMLMTYASKPGVEGNKAVPDLAEAPGVPSDGNKTWTYKLKKGIKYEDGNEVKAKDIKYAVARTYDRGVLGHGPAYFPQLLDADGYKGPFKDKNLDHFKGIETPDDYTVVFKLKDSFAELNELVMFSGQTAPVQQATDKGTRYALHPISTGPYKWEGDYKPGKGGALVRNENWDPATDPNRKQLPDRIEVTAGLKAEELDNRLLNGTLHVDLAGSGVQAAARQKILTDPKLKANADNPLAGFHWFIPINVKNIPNVECRKAIVYATDRDALFRAYGGEVGGELATSIMPPAIPGREKGQDLYTSSQPGYKGDVDKAKEALTKCGKPNGFETIMVFRSDRPKEKAAAEAMEQALSRANIKLTLKGFPAGTYTGEQFGSPAFVKKEKIGLGTYGWAPDWPTGYGYLQPISDGKAIVESGNSNPEEMNDPEINKLWNDVVKLETPAERDKVYNQIDTKLREQAALLPNVYAKSLLYRPPTLTNVYFHAGFGMIDYANLGVTG
ncbi:ABC transporter substrate-binding protein [Actinomadura sp. HBU206391]|uniref:ABC transporter substrate-binding protein n=1 Tax=Actinomadura sp. HBU206391 TaxID=2731692 RepID=UPI00164EFD9F|nr:ABC transporter substrate-binding protein [Actinomadura sp. HBU206391]MBC6462859.1 ABC transporter substrate-binding protein [Actinomadura sp. HBU206391]